MRNYKALAALTFALTLGACSTGAAPTPAAPPAPASAGASGAANGTGVEDGVFTVAMEAAYAPYNWAQPTDANGAVPIKGSNLFANGYDVMTAKHIAQKNGWKLEIVQLDWDSLIPAVQSGTVDAVIAGQSMTAEREKEVDFAGPYQVANMVVLTKKDSKFASAKGISDLAGAKATSQSGTVWYDSLVPQIPNVNRLPAVESAPAMLVALETGQVEIAPCDKPTAQGAVRAYPDLTILDFTGTKDNFTVSGEDVNVGISVRNGNTQLKDAINKALEGQTQADFDAQMAHAVEIAPLQNQN
ncbi:putative lysine transport system substrate-binding protein [Arcanobacterium wilhelmae]|uniref:Lysine transport system substrate-binding protein n=1 Tax=Arcanobacterium wilhelmae TaxID=1803177 RepID=A0ABT9ND82_9ACTO|nr:transporter substrate-binding domain-containing protein [Arcanobacterium wilhelmae]MDP9801680.1 putative lysine transport system substrate-binding protein [Arcanobacterium wilhelmae]WFN91001.1 transporter substrate-binding domain-containing protein [Arcanobacterium wilhelmae]